MDNQTSVLSDCELEQVAGGMAQFVVAMVVLGVTLFGTACAAYPSSPSSPTGMRRGTT